MSTTQQQEISLQFKKELFNKPPPVDHGAVLSSIQPHPEVLEKKKEVLQDLALQKQAVQEAKEWVQVSLVSLVCSTALMYLQQLDS